jgi:outer membrane lipoprotein-sorting protein
MKHPRLILLCSLLLVPSFAGIASVQTADDVIEKHIAALGGREALGKLTSRKAIGTVTFSVNGMSASGPYESYAKLPNKSRSYMKLDATSLGAGEMVIDQRFDGTDGWVLNSMQGDVPMSGTQLDNFRSGAFPTALLNYKQAGIKAETLPRETIDGKECIVLLITPKAGSPTRMYFDAETYMIVRSVTKISSPTVGEFEQMNEPSDYRAVDGVKVPFKLKNSTAQQSLTITLTKVENNVPIDEAMFTKK